MRMSEKGIKLLKGWEGFCNKPYKDQVGKATIGVGHLITSREHFLGRINIDGIPVVWASGLTDTQVVQLLIQDIAPREAVVNEHVKVELNQDQFDALVSFVFNVGDKAFRDSTLLRLLNAGNYDLVPTQLRRWVKGGGKVIQGLVERREKEIKLWSGGYSH